MNLLKPLSAFDAAHVSVNTPAALSVHISKGIGPCQLSYMFINILKVQNMLHTQHDIIFVRLKA